MGLTLEVENYIDLSTLANDIASASKNHKNHIYDQETPMKVEVSKDDFKRIETDLKVRGYFPGIRKESELMTNQWNVDGVQVCFLIKKEDEPV